MSRGCHFKRGNLYTDQLTDLEPRAGVSPVRHDAPPVRGLLTHVPRRARRQREPPRLIARRPRQRRPQSLAIQLPPRVGEDQDHLGSFSMQKITDKPN